VRRGRPSRGADQGHIPKADQDSRRGEQGYNCGLALVGHTTLGFDGRPPSSNANMAWAGNCAYVAGAGAVVGPPMPETGAGVAVVSVSDAGVPHHVANLRHPGSTAALETIHAVSTPEGRSILVVGQYGNQGLSNPPKPMDVYDVSDPDCTKFEHKATFYWPENIHNLTISENGRYVFATMPLQVIDISDLWDDDPKSGIEYLGNLDAAMEGPALAPGPYADLDDNLPAEVRQAQHPTLTSHEAWPSPDGRTLYLGGVTPAFELFTIVDVGRWLDRNPLGGPAGTPRVISQRSGRGHSVRTATIHGVPYVLHSEESVIGAAFGCLPETANPAAGPAQPWLTNVADPANPRLVSQFGLEINNPENCLAQMEARANQSVHYHDVDDQHDTTFVMASMWNAGLRVFDVRDPANPTEVACFNPGDVNPTATTRLDQAWAHVRYVPEKGHIWFTTAEGGFWVVRLEGKVRDYLNLDAKNVASGRRPLDVPVDDPGRGGTVGTSQSLPPENLVDVAPYYCTLDSAGSVAASAR
jgi:hypothetical protein